jgi:hypothetical protein
MTAHPPIYGGYVQPGYLPPGAKAEVIITGHYIDTWANNAAEHLTTRAIINMDDGTYSIYGAEIEDRARAIEAYPDQKSWGTDRFRYFTVRFKHKLSGPLQRRTKQINQSGGPDELWEWGIQVRFDVTGAGHFVPPKVNGEDKYIELESKQMANGCIVKSSLED